MGNVKTKSDNAWPAVITVIIYLAVLMISKLVSFYSGSNVISAETVTYLFSLAVILVLNKKFIKSPLFWANWHFPFSVWLVFILDVLKYLLLPGLLLGIALGLGGRFGSRSGKLDLLLVMAMIISAVIFEEICLQGILLPALIKSLHHRKYGVLSALVISALIFGFAHLFAPIVVPSVIPSKTLVVAIMHAISVAATGLVVGAIYLRSQNLILPLLLQLVQYPMDFLLIGITGNAALKFLPLAAYIVICTAAALYLIKDVSEQNWLKSGRN